MKNIYKWKKQNNKEWYKIKTNVINITIMNCHINYPEEWIMHCNLLNIVCYILNVSNVEDAKKKAIDVIEYKIKNVSDALKSITKE